MITVLLQTESHFPVNRKKITSAVSAYLSDKIASDAEVSISIVGSRRMKTLNSTYRKKDSATDVLSFPQYDPTQPAKNSFVPAPDDVLRLGDIVVSYPEARSEAMEGNTFVDDQIILLIQHGLDHLLGKHHPE